MGHGEVYQIITLHFLVLVLINLKPHDVLKVGFISLLQREREVNRVAPAKARESMSES